MFLPLGIGTVVLSIINNMQIRVRTRRPENMHAVWVANSVQADLKCLADRPPRPPSFLLGISLVIAAVISLHDTLQSAE